MKFYVLKRIEASAFGEVNTFVIVASKPSDARRIAQAAGGNETSDSRQYWTDKTLTTCQQLSSDCSFKEAQIVSRDCRGCIVCG